MLESGKHAVQVPDLEWRTEKTCSACGKLKPISEFYRQKKQLDGHQKVCKSCSKERYAAYFAANKAKINERSLRNQRRYREEDPEYTVRIHLRNLFGMELEDYDAKLAAQGGVCVICGAPPGPKRLHVDHDRDCCRRAKSCGRCIRDLLCSGCNNGTGLADNPELLRRRADYVEMWRERQRKAAATQIQ